MAKSIFRRLYELITGNTVYSFLNAHKEDDGRFKSSFPKKISEIDTSRIPTYPRFTVYDITIDKKNEQIIFDSSDFDVINYAFLIFDSLNGRKISKKSPIIFRGAEYIVEDVRIDFLNIFDDYSFKFKYFGTDNMHTSVYEGKDVPYNIQITIEVRPKPT